jgi:hypothetical protein
VPVARENRWHWFLSCRAAERIGVQVPALCPRNAPFQALPGVACTLGGVAPGSPRGTCRASSELQRRPLTNRRHQQQPSTERQPRGPSAVGVSEHTTVVDSSVNAPPSPDETAGHGRRRDGGGSNPRARRPGCLPRCYPLFFWPHGPVHATCTTPPAALVRP